ncbi:unnamed protein product [Agarophyton chilense]
MCADMGTKRTPTPPRRIIADNVYDGLADAIGNTPLIKLQRASRQTRCNIYGKAEFLNPGGSVKARAALFLITHAERVGLLTPGRPGIIVEATAGNTGISLAQIARARGYQCVIVIPSSQSQQKKDALRYAGAHLVQVPPKPYTNPNNYVKFGARLAKQLGAVYTNQFDNVANRDAHVHTTGPEIWAQLRGNVHAFSCAVGTGGTLAGTAHYLRRVNPTVKIALTDPRGAKLVSYYRHGVLKADGNSITEGIGQGRITANLQGFTPDYAFEIGDEQALDVVYKLMQEEGLCLGMSSGINVAGAMRVAKELGPGHNIVTVLCDEGTRYTDKLFNLQYLREKALPHPQWLATDLPAHVRDAVQQSKIDDEQAAQQQAANAAANAEANAEAKTAGTC